MAGMIALLVVAFVGTCVAQKPCCTPKQWTGSIGESVGSSTERRRGHDRRGFMSLASNITMDYTGQRIAMQTMLFRPGRSVSRSQLLANYKTKMGYMVVNSEKCYKFALKKPMPSNCIPSSAKYYGSIILGSRAAGLKVNMWGMGFRTRFMAGMAVLSVDKSCIPVGEQVTGGNRRTGFMANVGYLDITAGIRDPTVFKVPDICKKSEDKQDNRVHVVNPSVLPEEYQSYMLQKFVL